MGAGRSPPTLRYDLLMLSLTHIVLTGVVVLAVAYWWRALAAREVALGAARRKCEQLGLQLLDDIVALRGLWLKRNRRGQMSLWRAYAFEFSVTGGERYQGRVIMLSDRVEQIDLPAHVFHVAEAGDQERVH
jgi:hypothetical protein